MIKIQIQDQSVLNKFDFSDPAIWIATWGGSGFIKPGPGTWGTLAGLPFGLALMTIHPYALLVASLILFPLAYWSAKHFTKSAGEDDSPMIVVDEVMGIWITLLPASLDPVSVILAVVLFRFFDIVKPLPVSWIDTHFKGAFGVIADDLMAGVYAAICLILLQMGLHHVGLG